VFEVIKCSDQIKRTRLKRINSFEGGEPGFGCPLQQLFLDFGASNGDALVLSLAWESAISETELENLDVLSTLPR